MAYTVEVKPRARKDIRDLPTKEQDRIEAAIAALADDAHPPQSLKLVGEKLYRLKIGNYRALYTIDDEAQRIEVVRVGHRREIYDRLR